MKLYTPTQNINLSSIAVALNNLSTTPLWKLLLVQMLWNLAQLHHKSTLTKIIIFTRPTDKLGGVYFTDIDKIHFRAIFHFKPKYSSGTHTHSLVPVILLFGKHRSFWFSSILYLA